MPKNTDQKNNKGKSAKNNTTKKVNTNKKVETKVVKEKTPAKKVETKVVKEKTPAKKVEVKEAPVVKEEKMVKLERKSKFKENKLLSNTPFMIAMCAVVILLAVTIFLAVNKRVPKLKNGDEVIATINGKSFTANELYESLKENSGTDTLVNLIDSYIAKKEVTSFTDDDKKYAEDYIEYFKQYAEYYGVSLEDFIVSYLAIPGVTTEDQLYDYLLEDYRKTLAVRNFIADEASEDDLKKYYEDNYSDKLTVRHILIEPESDDDDADKAALNAAKKLIKSLDKVSDSKKLESEFEKLAKENSDDTGTYSDGGLMEDISKSDDLDENFWKAAYALKDGEYTKEPVKSAYGYHIILRISSTPVEKYEDIKDEVKLAYAEKLLNESSTLQVEKWDELRKKYKLSIKDDFIKENYDEALKSALENKETEEE